MEIKKNQIDDLNATISIDLKQADYLDAVNASIKSYKKQAQIKGFRKGHVPDGVIRKMYGNAILFEEINKTLSDALNKYIEDEKLELLGRPLPQENQQLDLDIKNPQDFEFIYDIALAPSFELPSYNTINIDKEVVDIDDKTLDDEVDKIAQRYGELLQLPEDATVEDKDVLTVHFKELDDKNIKEDGVQHTGVFNLEMLKDDKVKKQLLKAKLNDTLNINIFGAFDRSKEEVAKHFLGLEDNIPKNLSDDFEMTIEKISRTKKAEINQALFDKVYGPEVCKTEEEFRNKIKQELEGYGKQLSENKVRRAIFDNLVEKTNIPLPDDFLKRFIKVSNENPISDEQIEKEYPEFSKGLKWNLITSKIAKDNDLKTDFEDVKAFSREQVRQQMEMYNTSGNTIDDKTLDLLNDNMMQREDHVKKSYESAMEQKLFNFLESKVTLNDKKISFDDLLKNN
ncbi:MAG: trigger factor [Chitinophagales bacterium]|nr:trigger factor [Chitinophagales bacterium]